MKALIGTIIIFLICSCNQSPHTNNDVEISYDTININVEGNLGQIIEFNNNLYAIFRRNNSYNSPEFSDFYSISQKGNVITKTKLPKSLNVRYADLHLRNDSILIKDYYNHATYFYNSEANLLEQINQVDDLIFEDNIYKLKYLSFGEFGDVLWFEDKSTKIEYELGITAPRIHKTDSGYLITNKKNIIEINDPKSLKQCETSFYYKSVAQKEWSEGSNSIQGVKILYQDSTSWNFSKQKIITSFIRNNILYCIRFENDTTYLSSFEGSHFSDIKHFERGFQLYKERHSYRGNQYRNDHQIFKFSSAKKNGILRIDSNNIRVTYINNLYRP